MKPDADNMNSVVIATAEASPNIAVSKYWGKRDEKLMLPTEGSISVTMDEQLRTRTTVMFSPTLESDEIWVNNARGGERELGDIGRVLDVVRERSGLSYRARAASVNCFPAAAGLASSASGMAAFACAASAAAGLRPGSRELSMLARLGSGSACRSVLGGFVEWKRGLKADGSDSYAVQIANEIHWPELRNIIVIVDQKKKKISSRAGMKQTVETSALYKKRLELLPRTLSVIRNAILSKNESVFLEALMRESNDMHAVMMDTWPPIIYLNDVSKDIIYRMHEFNGDSARAGYTFDAGPNAHIYTTEKHVCAVLELLEKVEGVKRVIVCKVGGGPRYITDPKEHLIDASTGELRQCRYDEESGSIIVG